MKVNNTKVFGYYVHAKKDDSFKREVLSNYGCDELIKENLSGEKRDRTAFVKLMEKVRTEDTLVVNNLEELGKTKNQVIDLLFELTTKGVKFKSLEDKVFDTTESSATINRIVGRLKEIDFQIKSGNIKTGMRPRGRQGGRPKGSYNTTKSAAVAEQYEHGVPIQDILDTSGISKSTMYRYLRHEGVIK